MEIKSHLYDDGLRREKKSIFNIFNNKTYYPQTFFDVYIAIDQYNEIYCQ